MMELATSHKKIAFVLIAAIVLLFGLIAFLARKQESPIVEAPREQTQEEILQSLTAPSDGDARGLTDEEKNEILQSLSAPSR